MQRFKMRDFTHTIYKELLLELLAKGYQFVRVKDYFDGNYDKNRAFVIMRHDVDRRPNASLEMAKIEQNMDIRATYYFRTIPTTFKPDTIKQIALLNHEIGYHYESLAEKNGDYKEAIKDFEYNLNRLREFYPVKNIAMHGRPTSKWDSRDLWKEYNYKDFDIISEPYFDFDFNEILYITDAGRAWGDEAVNLRDKVKSQFDFKIGSTQEIVELLKESKLPQKIMFNIHPEHWAKSSLEWYEIYTIRKSKNFIKRFVIR